MNKIVEEPIVQIEDVQNRVDDRKIAINRVGVKALRHPVLVCDQNGVSQGTVAEFNLYVELPHFVKGTHMSRFVELVNDHSAAISIETFPELIAEMNARLESSAGYIEMSFPYFREKTAPASGVKSIMDYDVQLKGQRVNGEVTLTTTVTAAVTSLCPCSKQISEYGAHNQRSHVSISAKTNGQLLWIDELITIAEREASSELYGVLKRPDEKFVTEVAYDNPKFVEDLVRDIAVQLNADDRVIAYAVEAENFESIHNHSAYALIEKTKE